MASTWSLKNNPTIITGMMESKIFDTYSFSAFHFKLKKVPLKRFSISFQSITMVLNTVAA